MSLQILQAKVITYCPNSRLTTIAKQNSIKVVILLTENSISMPSKT